MPPGTHALLGWWVANCGKLPRRDRALVTLAGIAPDVDGFGLLADLLVPDSEQPHRWWTEFHHVLAHNGLAAMAMTLVAVVLSRRKALAGTLVAISFHLHLLCDLLGSGGPNGEAWDVNYFWPLQEMPVWNWSGQWRLDSWQNLLVTLIAIVLTGWLAVRRGYSPVSIFSPRLDCEIVATLRRWFRRPNISTTGSA